MQLWNMLSWWQWLALAAVPPAIIALYFLKLKRRPLEVPSTYLWHKSIEDLHVNTIWQRLRRNLLLLLQLLLLVLAMLALLRPGWRGTKLAGDRFIFLVDNSASMQATDTQASRLEEAKRRVDELIEQMNSGDVAMLVSFADNPRVEHMFTDDRRSLRRSLDEIRPSVRHTSIAEALKVASGLANPGRSAYEMTDVQVAEPLPATMYIASDGKFPPVPEFDPGNLDPVYLPVGNPLAENVGIVVFNVRRHETRTDELEAYARVENFGSTAALVSCEIDLDGRLFDADRFEIAAGEAHSILFPVGAIDSGVLHLKLSADDDFALDNEAWSVVSIAQRAQVLVVTPGNRPLELALTTQTAVKLADVDFVAPDFLGTEDYRRRTNVSADDLVIFDRCRPEVPPQANTFYIGALPPGDAWRADEAANSPTIIDVDPAHPLMQWVAVGDVLIDRGTPLAVPPGGSVLIDSHVGPLLVIAPRAGFEDAALGFVLIDEREDENGNKARYLGTNWLSRTSFPVFAVNLLEYLGGARRDTGGAGIVPGEPIEIEALSAEEPVEVRAPSGKQFKLRNARRGKLQFTNTSELGVYEARSKDKLIRQFAVNLFDRAESDIVPSNEIRLPVPIAGKASGWEAARRELWKVLLVLGLGILCFEWYIYNKRVYM
jgi:hypothetical protein